MPAALSLTKATRTLFSRMPNSAQELTASAAIKGTPSAASSRLRIRFLGLGGMIHYECL
jgi:hypothetical protein